LRARKVLRARKESESRGWRAAAFFGIYFHISLLTLAAAKRECELDNGRIK